MFEGAGDQEDIARVGVHVAHEALDALAGRAFVVAEVEGDGGLEALAQHVHGAVDVVMHLGADAQQEIVGGFQLLALAFADEVVRLQLLEGTDAILEEGHPEQVLIVAQAAAAVLEVGLLHAGGVAELGAPGGLVGQAHGDVFLLVPDDTFADQGLLEPLEQLLVARDEPRLDERGLGLHVAVGDLDAVLDAADRVADLEADVPQRVERAVNDAGQMRQRAGAGGDLPAVQEHEVNVAVRD